jgi:hypothetical protein
MTDARAVIANGGGPLAIPVLLSEPGRLTSLLKEAVDAEGGSFLTAVDWSEIAPSGPEASLAIPTLSTLVQNTIDQLVRLDPSSYAGLSIDATTPGSRAIQGPVPYASANSAQQAARGIFTAVFHQDLRSGGLVVLLWDDQHFDADSSRALFVFAQSLPEALQLDANSVLVVVIGDKARTGYHCVGERGVRYAVTPGRGFESREPYGASRERCREWVRNDQADASLAVLFLGAGSSVSAGLRTGNDLRDEALGRRIGTTVDSSTYDMAARALFRTLRDAGRLLPIEIEAGEAAFGIDLTLERIVREEQHEENLNLSHTLRVFKQDHDRAIEQLRTDPMYGMNSDPLRSLLEGQQQIVLVTVNFDQVVETRCAGLVRPFVSEADLTDFAAELDRYKANGGVVPLLKLHGDIDQPDTLVANSDDTAGGLSTSRLRALQNVRDALEPARPWWYVGYSMRDLDLLPTFSSQTFSDGLAERWIAPMLDENVDRFVTNSRIARWETLHRRYSARERAISLGAEEFWQVLAALRP